jgi:uncharacterized protein (DUF1810 family)
MRLRNGCGRSLSGEFEPLTDPRPLDRFVIAQQDVYDSALAELCAGRKVGHWMWFIFPQIAGLGQSPTAEHYAIASLEEARVYLADAVLGERLIACTQAVNNLSGSGAPAIFGFPDVLKFRSCMTLFARAAPENPIFQLAIDRYYDGVHDAMTLELLEKGRTKR